MTEMSDLRFTDRIRSRFLKTIREYDLISPDDQILIAVSGGKDSLALLEMMAWRRKILSSPRALFAAHVKPAGLPEMADIPYLEELCELLRVPFMVSHAPADADPGKGGCFICSRSRRKELFILAEQLKCNKIAFGHHRDDIVETLLMNMIHHGTFSTMPVQLEMFGGTYTIIRPLAYITEAELTRYASLKGFPQQTTQCPIENLSQRNEVRKIILEMVKLNKKAKQNLFRSISHIEAEHLP